jgi:hypothetical protein
VGTPGRSLVDYARHEDDLLVVGAGGQSRWRCWWHGSVSGYCVRHARCPVLTVPLPEFARTMQRALAHDHTVNYLLTRLSWGVEALPAP